MKPLVYSYTQASLPTLPFYTSYVHAGFPSPADDFVDVQLDLNEYLVKNPVATFFIRVSGDAMRTAGIFSGDILIVDRSLGAYNNCLIIAILNGELLVRQFKTEQGRVYLLAANKNYQAIEVGEDMQFEVWGVVTAVIHRPV